MKRFAEVQIEQQDFAHLIAAYDSPETLFYCDPPYLPETRSAGGYRHEMTRDDHLRLLETITHTKGMVILSGYRSNLYDEALRDWQRIDKLTVNHSSNVAREKRTECIWLSPNIARQPTLWQEVV
jgi:DNA adenine methylase